MNSPSSLNQPRLDVTRVKPPPSVTLGLWLGLLAVAMFGLSLPMTKLAVGTHDAPLLSPWFSSFGRAALGGVCALLYLGFVRAPIPRGSQWRGLAWIGLGNAVMFPILQTIALVYVPSSHAAVFNGLLPMFTAVIAAILLHQRPRVWFWWWASVAAALVVVFALWRAYIQDGHFAVHWADILMLIAVGFCGFGYAHGAKLAQEMPAAQSLSWMLVLYLPLTTVVAWWHQPTDWSMLPWSAWGGFLYIAVFSMWLGMMIWFYALHIGGALRVSQIQILQPFLTIVFSMWLLGEAFDVMTWAFAAAVIAAAYQTKRWANAAVLPRK